MNIYTKTGDTGTTSLVGGDRVSKSCARVRAYGDLDELISWLGVIRSDVNKLPSGELPLRRIQIDLMNISSHFAAAKPVAKLKPLDESMVKFLEEQIDAITEWLPEQTTFILPGSPRASSECHVARTVCRRAERDAVAIENRTEQDDLGLKYLNRLSDYLFCVARLLCTSSGVDEDRWIP